MERTSRWTKNQIIGLFKQGRSFEEVKAITGLPGRLLGGFKGFLNSPMYRGQPIPQETRRMQTGARQGQTQPRPSPGSEAGSRGLARVTRSEMSGVDEVGSGLTPGEPPAFLEPGSKEARAPSTIAGKPYLIPLRNAYVSPDTLKCYQFLVARGYKGSVAEFMEACVLKLFRDYYGLQPAMVRLQATEA